jgi:hypothetical protein
MCDSRTDLKAGKSAIQGVYAALLSPGIAAGMMYVCIHGLQHGINQAGQDKQRHECHGLDLG